MAYDPSTIKGRRNSEIEPGVWSGDAGSGGSDAVQPGKRRTPYADMGQATRQKTAPNLSHETQPDIPTPPINVPYNDRDSQRTHYGHPFADADAQMEPTPDDTNEEGSISGWISSPPSGLSLNSDMAQAPKSEHPRLSVRTKPRGRSLLDEIARDKFGVTSDKDLSSRKERSAAMNITSIEQTVPEEAIVETVPSLSESLKGSSPPIEEVPTPIDRSASMFDLPISGSPAGGWNTSQSPASAASSWYGRRFDARPGSVRRTSRRTGATPVSESPASAFLRQYSTTSLKVREEDSEGVEVGDYVLGRELGSGGFSLVREAFSASSPSNTPSMAVKIVRKQAKGRPDSENEELQAQFEREIEVWRPLQHPNVLRLYEAISNQFATYAFMPLIQGGSLWDMVKATKNQGVELPLARQCAAQITQGLRYLHQDMRLVHRDVKLENCLISTSPGGGGQESDGYFPSRPVVMLADFGLAEYIPAVIPELAKYESESPVASSPTSPCKEKAGPPGSLHYAAPELLYVKKLPPLSPKIDTWAFGVLLFALVTGRMPFQHTFAPKLVEQIKSGDFDRQLLQEKIDSAQPQWGVPTSPKALKDRHECGNIFRNESWARSCHTIVETEGVPPSGGDLKEIVDGCLNTKPQERWDIARLIEADWLATEIGSDDEDSGLEMASR